MMEHSESVHKLEPGRLLDSNHPSSAEPRGSNQAEPRARPLQSNLGLSDHETTLPTGGELYRGEENLGFIGPVSEISWIHSILGLRVRIPTRNPSDSQNVTDHHSILLKELNYFTKEF